MKLFKRFLLLFCIICFITACSKKIVLPEPVLVKNTVPIQKQEKKHKSYARSILKVYTNSLNQKQDKILVHKALKYLINMYGKPRYKGTVEVYIKQTAIQHPKVSWTTNDENIRKVLLSSFYMFPSELPTIAHELFHAFYQTSSMIENYPEFILEGMAIYVENRYKYKTNKIVKEKITNRMKNDAICKKIKKLNLNYSFDFYGDKMKYYLYIAGGDFFAHQKQPNKLIRQMINQKIYKKQTLLQIVDKYQLPYFPCNMYVKNAILHKYTLNNKKIFEDL